MLSPILFELFEKVKQKVGIYVFHMWGAKGKLLRWKKRRKERRDMKEVEEEIGLRGLMPHSRFLAACYFYTCQVRCPGLAHAKQPAIMPVAVETVTESRARWWMCDPVPLQKQPRYIASAAARKTALAISYKSSTHVDTAVAFTMHSSSIVLSIEQGAFTSHVYAVTLPLQKSGSLCFPTVVLYSVHPFP